MNSSKPAVTVSKLDSLVEAVDSTGAVFKGFYIWTNRAPAAQADPDVLFAKCLVLPGSTKGVLRCRQVEPEDPREFTVTQAEAFNCNANIDPMTYGDIGMIPHKNAPCVLDFLKRRYMQGQIYTTADPLLVAINPFRNLGNTTDEVIEHYRDADSPSKLPPHVFSIARSALENLHMVNKSQTIIVSGESGAGKTEATKQIMRYLAAAKSGTVNTKIQAAVLAASPVLEAFGNAKTVRNNNSSRFGRFMQLQVASGGGIEYGFIQNFLLEKSRIVTQDVEERSYHIFYQFLKGTTPEQRAKYALKGLKEYKILNPLCLEAAGINDIKEWHEVLASLRSMRRTEAEIDSILSILSGILLLGNVDIAGGDIAHVSPNSKETFRKACSLLFLDPDLVHDGFCVKISSAGGDVVRGYWNEKDAEVLKHSLCKAIYDKLFDWIVRRLNENIQPKHGFTTFLGMLDIFGFEVFATNSLEQLFINITNEMLQKNFIDIVFDKETRLYREEGISTAELVWTSNEDVISMLAGKTRSLMAVLEDQCLAPAPVDEKFVSSAYAALKEHKKFLPAKVQPNVNFVVVHTIGPIQYTSTGFLAKNMDILRPDLVSVVQKSSNEVVHALFQNVVVQRGKLAKGQLTGSQFLNQLRSLMDLIQSTEPHFIRCVKPNEDKRPLMFTQSKVLVQLCALSVLEALELRNLGFSYRRPFAEFVRQFRFIDLGIASRKTENPSVLAVQLLRKARIPESDYQIGRSMIFLKAHAVKNLTQRQRECMALWDPLVTILEAMILKKWNEKIFEASLPGLRRFQANVRRLIAY